MVGVILNMLSTIVSTTSNYMNRSNSKISSTSYGHNSHFRSQSICSIPCNPSSTCCSGYCFDTVQNGVCCYDSNNYNQPYACPKGYTCAGNGYCYNNGGSSSVVAIVATVVLLSLCCIGVFMAVCFLKVLKRRNQPPPQIVVTDGPFAPPVVHGYIDNQSHTQTPTVAHGYAVESDPNLPVAPAYISKSIETTAYVQPNGKAQSKMSVSSQRYVN